MIESTVGLFKGAKKGWMEVYSGKAIDPLNLKPEDIRITDIAHALSNICRYGGHCAHFYSVAEHSVRVADIVPIGIGLAALLHDAAEAYLGDVIRPLKHLFPDIMKTEAKVAQLIMNKYVGKLDPEQIKCIRDADNVVGATEARDLMASGGKEWGNLPLPLHNQIAAWASWVAEDIFLKRFEFYGGVE